MSDLTPFLQTLRERHILSDIVRPYVKLIRKGKDYTGLCPFHKEKSPSFFVNDDKGFYHCFGCGVHGDIFDFIMQHQNLPFIESVDLLASLLGLEVPKWKPSNALESTHPKPDQSLYEAMEAACRWFEKNLTLSQGNYARSYLETRKLLPETIAQFRLGFAPERGLQEGLLKEGFTREVLLKVGLIGQSEDRSHDYDRFRGRLMFPIWDAKGRVIAFGGRILKEGEPKYLNSPDTLTFSKGKILYAYNRALPIARGGPQREGHEPLIVVEGYMDVIALHQAGFKTAVAPLGTALTPEQMALLWKGSSDPILCFDGDMAGTRAARRAAEKALNVLKVGQTLRFSFLPSGEDPDSLLRQGRTAELRGLLSQSQPLVDMIWLTFSQGRDFSTPEQKALARRDLGSIVKEIADPDVRHFYREELTARFQTLMVPAARDQGTLQNSRSIQYGQRPGGGNAWQGRSSPPFSVPLVSSFRPMTNKNYLGAKILLATLLNHPTLIEDIAESLIRLSDVVKEYESFCQTILALIAENPSLFASELQNLLKQHGFGSLLGDLLSRDIYLHAPFARASATREEVLAGWRDVWNRTVENDFLRGETSRSAAVARDQLDEQSWEQFKHMKAQNFKDS